MKEAVIERDILPVLGNKLMTEITTAMVRDPWANNPPSEQHLFISCTTLAETENNIHHSSIAGEISDTFSYLIKSFGTESLIAYAKEMAGFRMDELKYRSNSARNSGNYWLTFVFGLVGVTSFAEFAVNPLILNKWSGMNKVIAPFISFGISAYLLDAEMMASEGKYNGKPDKTAAGAAVCVGVTLFCFACKVTRRRFRQPVYWRRDTLRLKTRYQPVSCWHRL